MKPSPIEAEVQQAAITQATRRHFLHQSATGLGGMWLASQSCCTASASQDTGDSVPHWPAKVKRVIYLHMVGAPSQLELFDYKPDLERLDGKTCPTEFLENKRFAFIQGIPQMLGPQYPFSQHGQSGAWFSDRLPHLSKHADDICFIKAMQTDQFNHGPAQLMVHSGQPRIGYPSIGAWTTWGLGTENRDLPGFIVLLSGGRLPRVGKALWGSGFLPSVYQGVQCRSKGDPVLDVTNPSGVTRQDRRSMLDTLAKLNQRTYDEFGDAETLTRISQYEMAFRMQIAAPEAMDLSDEPAHLLDAYGASPAKESFANNCLLARRLAERGVRFIQLFDWGWDTHGTKKEESLNIGFKDKCKQIDRPISALLTDLRQRGLLDDTLVVWGGEFGRTPMRENRGGAEMKFIGRDHNPSAFTVWMAGAGVKAGFTYGETDPVGYSAAENAVQIRDFHATLLHLMGIDHQRLTHRYLGLNQKLTSVKESRVVREILA